MTDSSQPEPAAGYRSAAITHVGTVRTANQDAVLDRPARGLWCVADGMGGHSAGELASARLIETLDALSAERLSTDGVIAAVREVNLELTSLGKARNTTIGSTIAVLLANGATMTALWAGDSRIGRLRQGQFEWLTRDHSFVQELIDRGEITPEQADRHPMRHLITRVVGVDPDPGVEALALDVRAGDVLLVCSDGLIHAVPEAEIGQQLGQPDPHATVKSLLATALHNGARDNVSAVVVRVT